MEKRQIPVKTDEIHGRLERLTKSSLMTDRSQSIVTSCHGADGWVEKYEKGQAAFSRLPFQFLPDPEYFFKIEFDIKHSMKTIWDMRLMLHNPS